MLMSRRSISPSAPSFGRRAPGLVAGDAPRVANDRSAEARLFALTFAGGFLFMSVYLA